MNTKPRVRRPAGSRPVLTVVPFRPRVDVAESPPADAQMVDLLSQMMERAKAGEFAAVAVAVALNNGGISTGYVVSEKLWVVIGALADLEHRLLTE